MPPKNLQSQQFFSLKCFAKMRTLLQRTCKKSSAWFPIQHLLFQKQQLETPEQCVTCVES